MVVIVDLDDDALDQHQDARVGGQFPALKQLHHSLIDSGNDNDSVVRDDRPNPNVNGFSAALSCYPIVSQLASQLDLNTLHNLARTCRQFRVNLLEYRDQLVKNSLHCVNEDAAPSSKLADRFRESQTAWASNASFSTLGRITSGKVGQCARDMVGECQRCGNIVCRNCTTKPPPIPTLRTRHRRLCRTCSKAPLHMVLAPLRPRSANSPHSPENHPNPLEQPTESFTTSAFQRTPCSCEDTVWLCQPCGQHVRSADTTYIRGWTWRTRYSHYLGGLGTGIGEGNEGVECGRGASCLGAKIVEQDIDCNAETLATLEEEAAVTEQEGSSRGWTGTSYMIQEVEGVGGTVKRKVKKQVWVGQVVREYEDERDRSMTYLEREVQGKLRSWCAWCQRIIPSQKDKREPSSNCCSSDEESSSRSSSVTGP